MGELKTTQDVTSVETIASVVLQNTLPAKTGMSGYWFKAPLVLRHPAACDRRGKGCEGVKNRLHFTN